MTDGFKTYLSALDWLFYQLPTDPQQIFKAEKSLKESALLLAKLGNPQDDYKTIHVAGTSGKGSTVALVSDILRVNSKHVGSIFSPHVYDFRERFMIDGKFVSKNEVLEAVNCLKPILNELNLAEVFPSYYQAVIALAYLVFSKHKLDYLVIETGLGGLYDTTNSITRNDKVALLNSIGLDHTEILGDSLEEIAVQKAGIISKDSVVFALDQGDGVNQVFATEAKSRGAGKFIKVDKTTIAGNYSDSMKSNLSLAAQACKYLAKRDGWVLSESSIIQVAKDFKLPGRFEQRQVGDKLVILDGAHNPQKTKMLLENLSISYPAQKFNVLFASSKKRRPGEILELLAPVTDQLYLVSYSVFKGDKSRGSIDFSNFPDAPKGAKVIDDLAEIIDIIHRSKEDWLVTGSFFLVSDIGSRLL